MEQSNVGIKSMIWDDLDLRDLLSDFVAGLDERVENMEIAIQGGVFTEVRNLAHQLKGAGGSYGYPSLSEVAGELEVAALRGDQEMVRLHYNKLKSMCVDIKAGFEE